MSYRSQVKVKLLELLEQSVIISGIISIGLVTTCCVMWIKQLPVPNELLMALSTVLAFFFGARIQRNVNRTTKVE